MTAVDVSEKYLENLRARLHQDNVTNVDVVVGTVDDPRLPAEAYDAVLVYNAYHEMTAPEAILKAIFAALKPGGRFVMAEPLHDNLRSATRAEQVKDHEIGPQYVQQELQAAGFDIVEQHPDFLAFTSPGHKGGFWMIIARKPVRQESLGPAGINHALFVLQFRRRRRTAVHIREGRERIAALSPKRRGPHDSPTSGWPCDGRSGDRRGSRAWPQACVGADRIRSGASFRAC